MGVGRLAVGERYGGGGGGGRRGEREIGTHRERQRQSQRKK